MTARIDKYLSNELRLQELKELAVVATDWDKAITGQWVSTGRDDLSIISLQNNFYVGDQLRKRESIKSSVLVADWATGKGRTITVGQWIDEGWMMASPPELKTPLREVGF